MPMAELRNATLHYKSNGSGPPVLGIMGFGLDQRYWAAQMPAVTVRNRFITYDNRGTGRSSGPAVGTITELAADAVALLEHLDLDRVVVFGVSMGGAVAQRLALDWPEKVSALILAMTWARPIEFMRRQNNLARMLMEAGGSEALLEGTLVRMFSPEFFEIGTEAIERILGAFTASGSPEIAAPEVLLAQLDAIDAHDTIGELPKIDRPTLVIAGRMDMMVPHLGAREIAAAIPGAELVTLETGHGLMVEEMQAVNDAITAFLRTLDRG